jgi:hypothetical protein
LNSEQVEAAVVAYLAAGADEAVAGRTNIPNGCPVARATDGVVGAKECYESFAWKTLTPTLCRFVALVDAEPWAVVTFARCRELWAEAKGER